MNNAPNTACAAAFEDYPRSTAYKLTRRKGKRLQFAVCSFAHEQFAVCSLHFAVCILQFAVCSLHFALCSLHFAVCTLRVADCSLQFAGLEVCKFGRWDFAVCSLQFAVCSLQRWKFASLQGCTHPVLLQTNLQLNKFAI